MSALTARYHIAGITDTGPVGAAIRVTSGADYHNTFGGRTTASQAVYDDVATFLSEGGREVYVTRVGGTGPTPADYVSALDATGDTAPGGAVAIPGQPVSLIGARLIAHAARFGKTAIMCGRQDESAEVVARNTAALTGRAGAEAAGVFWPWIARTPEGSDRPVYQAPTGYVAAVRARAHLDIGAWAYPDGPRSTAHRIHALRFPNTPASNQELAEAGLSPLVTTREGVQLHGWWSMGADRANFSYLDTRDLLNSIAAELSEAYADVTAHTWDTMAKNVAQITAMTKACLATMAKGGAFTPLVNPDGAVGDPGYVFTVSTPDLQPPDRNVVLVRVGVRPRAHAVLMGVRVFRVPLTSPLTQEVARA